MASGRNQNPVSRRSFVEPRQRHAARQPRLSTHAQGFGYPGASLFALRARLRMLARDAPHTQSQAFLPRAQGSGCLRATLRIPKREPFCLARKARDACARRSAYPNASLFASRARLGMLARDTPHTRAQAFLPCAQGCGYLRAALSDPVPRVCAIREPACCPFQ